MQDSKFIERIRQAGGLDSKFIERVRQLAQEDEDRGLEDHGIDPQSVEGPFQVNRGSW